MAGSPRGFRRRGGAPQPKTDHLRPYWWKPGESGSNPGPHPGMSLTALMKARLAEKGANGRTVAHELAETWIERAKGGSYPHLLEILNRTDGRIVDRVELTGPGGEGLFNRLVEALGVMYPTPIDITPPQPAIEDKTNE